MLSVLPDTSLWLRIVEPKSDQHSEAMQALQILSAQAEVVLAPQILVEFWAVTTRPLEARGLGWTISQTVSRLSDLRSRHRLIPDGLPVFEEWHRLVEQFQITGKRVHDARIAATAIVNGIDCIATFNSADFGKLPIKSISPADVVKGTIFGGAMPSS